MPKMMLHDEAAREALGRGVHKLARAVAGTLGPNGMNAVIDRPIGTPIISRDGVTIAAEIELECPFENMGAQIVREVSKQTNDVAGDGTTTATVLADALVQGGLKCVREGANAVELVQGMELGVAEVIASLKSQAIPVSGPDTVRAVASIAANDDSLGCLVSEAFAKAGSHGIVDVQYGVGMHAVLEFIEGMTFDRGYLSHHMATDVETMQAVLDHPHILITDNKITSPTELARVYQLMEKSKRPLLIIAEDIAPACVMDILTRREKHQLNIVAVNPPEYGHWRKAMLEDIAIATGGRVVARDLGGRIENCELEDLGSAHRATISAARTAIAGGGGSPAAVSSRREQVSRQYEAAPENIERDKYQERLAKLSGGTALILSGGATPVELRRKTQLIEDAINAARGALSEGVVPGGGTALLRTIPALDKLANGLKGSVRRGSELVREAVQKPLERIAKNGGLDGAEQVKSVLAAKHDFGFNARTGKVTNLVEAGVVDPVKVVQSAMRNAASVAGLILTTHTLVAKRPDDYDPTAEAARGGGAELLGRTPPPIKLVNH
jgi:chaperonin GroEL